jgi:hypothetical protein
VIDCEMSSPSDKDLAEFFYHALRLRLVPPEAVTIWADEVIAGRDDPPLWAIDLAMSGRDQEAICDVLRHVPGEASEPVPGMLLSARLGQLFRSGELSWEDAWKKGWELSQESVLPRLDESGAHHPHRDGPDDWTQIIGGWWDLYYVGSLTDAGMIAKMHEQLDQFREYEILLPNSVGDINPSSTELPND